MKLIIAGSRDFVITNNFLNEIILGFKMKGEITEVVSGKALGVDLAGEAWAKNNNINIKPFPADWNKFGNSAGPKRNKEMAEYADILLLIWDGESGGSYSMKSEMERAKKPIFEVVLRTKNL